MKKMDNQKCISELGDDDFMVVWKIGLNTEVMELSKTGKETNPFLTIVTK